MKTCKAYPTRPAKLRSSLGFTLIELMVTIAIIGIIAAVALPNYSKYVMRSTRAAAQTELMDISNRQQQYLLANRTYATVAELSYTLPTSLAAKYSAPTITASRFLDSACAVQTDTGAAPSYVITLAPISGGAQAADGTLYLSSTGSKCPVDKW